MKYRFLILLTILTLATSPVVSAADDTTKRRPDRTEFVTESHVRLTTESLTIAEVTEATPTSPANQGLLMMLKESWLDFVESIRNLF